MHKTPTQMVQAGAKETVDLRRTTLRTAAPVVQLRVLVRAVLLKVATLKAVPWEEMVTAVFRVMQLEPHLLKNHLPKMNRPKNQNN